MARPRIVVADDNPEIRDWLRGVLEADFDVAALAADGKQAIDSVLGLSPDILVTDISMPILNGIEVATRLRALDNRTKVIFITVHNDDDYKEAAFSAGAYGYVLKGRISTDLVPAMHAALQGKRSSSITTAPRT